MSGTSFGKLKEKGGKASKMRRSIFVGASLVLLLLCLSGCSEERTIVGNWQDDDGYRVQFLDNGTFVEDSYGTAMPYTYDGENIFYMWADGYSRYTSVNFPSKGTMSLQINGKLRNFKATKSASNTDAWAINEIPISTETAGKLELRGDSGVQSSIYLMSDSTFSLNWNDTRSKAPDWHVPADNCILGRYADRGARQSLVLYTLDDVNSIQYEQLMESPSGTYVATMKLGNNMDTIKEDWSSPVDWRGYVVSGQIVNEDNNITYTFTEDNLVLKRLSDGMVLSYAYFIDKEGLITLSCLDGFLDTDCMWLDTETGFVYRMVYERDSWVEYMHAIALADKMTTVESNSPSSSGTYVVDANIISEVGADNATLLGGPGSILQDLYKAVSDAEVTQSIEGYRKVEDAHSTLEYELMSKEEREAQIQKEKEEFLAEMGVLAEQRKIDEQRAEQEMRDKMLAEGYVFDPETQTWYIPGSTSTGVYVGENPWEGLGLQKPGEITVNSDGTVVQTPGEETVIPGSATQFGGGVPTGSSSESQNPSTHPSDEEPVDKPVNTTVGKVTFICNCNACHTDDYPVTRGATNVALVDATIWTPGTSVLLGDTTSAPQVTLMDSRGTVSGDAIHAYFADHNWVAAQKNGTYTVIPIGG